MPRARAGSSGPASAAATPPRAPRPTVTARHRRSGCAAVSATSRTHARTRCFAASLENSTRTAQPRPCTPPTVPTTRVPSGSAGWTGHVDVARLRCAGQVPGARGDQLLDVVEHLREDQGAQLAGRQLAAPPLRGAAAGDVQTGEPVAQQPVADRPALQRVQGDGQGVGGVVVEIADGQPDPSGAGTASPGARRTRRGRRARRSSRRAAGSGPGRNGGGCAFVPAAARHPASSTRSKLNGSRVPSAPAVKLRASKGCRGCRTTMRPTASGPAVAATASSSSPSGTAGGRRAPVRASAPE